MRRYVEQFLHGKAYLFGDARTPARALVSSANLTGAGLIANLELGLADYEPAGAERGDRLVRRAVGATPSTSRTISRDLLFPAAGLVDPDDRLPAGAARALRPAELEEPRPRDAADRARAGDLPARRLRARPRRSLERHGGVVYADGVGTGKTEIGLAFIEEYALKEDGVYALVVAPGAAREALAASASTRRKLPAQVISFSELATDEQLAPRCEPPRRRVLHVARTPTASSLVDEAHALRNEDTTWYRAMERLLGGDAQARRAAHGDADQQRALGPLQPRDAVRAPRPRRFALERASTRSRRCSSRAGANERDPENLDPDVLFPLADAVSVRRDRAFIEREYAGEQPSPTARRSASPTPRLETVRYDLDDAHPGLFERDRRRRSTR